ncbi:MAG: YqaJ viral recombinase family protein, partial [Pseudomonadota bacterium]
MNNKNIIKESAGVSFIVREWADIIYQILKGLNPSEQRLIIDGQDYPLQFKEFSVDYFVIDFNDWTNGYLDETSGYDKDGNYVVHIMVLNQFRKQPYMLTILNHEVKHAYQDWQRRSKGYEGIFNTKEVKEVYTGDFIKIIKDKINLKMKKIETDGITKIVKEESNTNTNTNLTNGYKSQTQSYSYSNKSFYSKNKFEQDKPEYTNTRPIYKTKVIEPTIFMKDSKGNTITEGEAMSSRTKAVVLEEITPEQYDKRAEIFEKIRAIILPEQRSPEWFSMRNGKITASDGGAVVGKNKHEPQFNFIMKKVFGSTFETGEACYHGKKFEQVVTMMYEYKNDVYTEEFGLLG